MEQQQPQSNPNENILLQLLKSQIGVDDPLNNIDLVLSDIIKDNITSLTKSGQDQAFTDVMSGLFQTGVKGNQQSIASKQFESIVKEYSTAATQETNTRKELYKSYKYLVNNIPELDNAIEAIAENILTPDEIFTKTLLITPQNKIVNRSTDEMIDSCELEANRINSIMNALEIESSMFNWISNALLLGITFVEIVNAKTMVMTNLSESETFGIENVNPDYKKKFEDAIRKQHKSDIDSLCLTENVLFEYKPEGKSNRTEKLTEKKLIEGLIEHDFFSFTDEVELSEAQKEVNAIEKSLHRFDEFNYKNAIFDSLTAYKKKSKSAASKIVSSNGHSEPDTKAIKNYEEETTSSLENILLITHNSEDVIKVLSSGITVGYIVVSKEEVNNDIRNKIFGTVGNVFSTNPENMTKTTDKFSSFILDKIKSHIKSATGLSNTKIKINKDELNKVAASMILEQKKTKARFVNAMSMIEFVNRSKYSFNDYGTSTLNSALFLAKYYIALLTSYVVFNITRAPEKRLVAVETRSDTDTERSIQNVVKAMKTKEQAFANFGQLEGIPREITQFNDIFVAARDGRTPVQFSAIPGQTTNIDMSLINDILRQIILATKVPPTLIGDNQNSYKTSISQESLKFANTIKRKQADFGMDLTKGIAKIYKIVHGEIMAFNKITFNPPVFAKFEQIASMTGQANMLVDFIVSVFGQNDDSSPKMSKLDVAKELVPYIDWNKFEKILSTNKRQDAINAEFGKLKNTDPGIDNQINNDNMSAQGGQPMPPQQ